MAMLDLASVKFERGEASQAMQVYEDTLGRLDAAEANQPHGRAVLREVRAGCLLNSARAAVRAGELARAEASLRESLAIAEEKWGPTSPRVRRAAHSPRSRRDRAEITPRSRGEAAAAKHHFPFARARCSRRVRSSPVCSAGWGERRRAERSSRARARCPTSSPSSCTRSRRSPQS